MNGTNGNGNGSGNGNGRKRISLSELQTSVGTIDRDAAATHPASTKNTSDEIAHAGQHEEANGARNNSSASSQTEKSSKQPDVLLNYDEDAPACAETLNENEKRGTRRRRLLAFGIAAGVLVLFTAACYLWLFAESGEEYRVRPAERRGAGASVDSQTQSLSAEEIRRELDRARSNANTNESSASAQNNASQTNANVTGGTPITERLPLGDYSATVTAPSVAPALSASPTVAQQSDLASSTGGRSSTDGTRAGANVNANEENASTGNPNAERSIRISQLQGRARDEGAPSSATGMREDARNSSANETGRTRADQVAVPPMGTMLPVRTLGTLYTLRSEGYVRMQLTRAASGNGWSLPRGAEVYGRLRGSDFEIGRAYVEMVGFIDPRGGGFVRLEGSVVGADGTEGLRGHKRNLNSGWTRALRIAGAGFIEALSTVAAGVGRQPVYIGDIYGYGAPRMTSPLMRELNGLAYRQDRAGFVEVPAGANGYVLVMTVPREVRGVDADAEGIRRIRDANNERAEGQMNEQELAELMTTGSRDEIRRALPRMTPEMRRIAESLLSDQ